MNFTLRPAAAFDRPGLAAGLTAALMLAACQSDSQALDEAPIRTDTGFGGFDDVGNDDDSGPELDSAVPDAAGAEDAGEAIADAGPPIGDVCPSAALSPGARVAVFAQGRQLSLLRANGIIDRFAVFEPAPLNRDIEWLHLLVEAGRVLAIARWFGTTGNAAGVAAVLYGGDGVEIWRLNGLAPDGNDFSPRLSASGAVVLQSSESEITHVAVSGRTSMLSRRRVVGLSSDGTTVATVPDRRGAAFWWTPATGAFDLVWPLPSRRSGFSDAVFDPQTGFLAQAASSARGIEIVSARLGQVGLPVVFRADTIGLLEMLDVSSTGDVIWRPGQGDWILTRRSTGESRPLTVPDLRRFETCLAPGGGFDAAGRAVLMLRDEDGAQIWAFANDGASPLGQPITGQQTAIFISDGDAFAFQVIAGNASVFCPLQPGWGRPGAMTVSGTHLQIFRADGTEALLRDIQSPTWLPVGTARFFGGNEQCVVGLDPATPNALRIVDVGTEAAFSLPQLDILGWW